MPPVSPPRERERQPERVRSFADGRELERSTTSPHNWYQLSDWFHEEA